MAIIGSVQKIPDAIPLVVRGSKVTLDAPHKIPRYLGGTKHLFAILSTQGKASGTGGSLNLSFSSSITVPKPAQFICWISGFTASEGVLQLTATPQILLNASVVPQGILSAGVLSTLYATIDWKLAASGTISFSVLGMVTEQ